VTDALVVAIDGPGGVGKSTVSSRVAAALEMAHLDTGAFYRAATLLVLEAGADPADDVAVEGAVTGAVIDQHEGRTTIGERDVSAPIRSDDVTAAVSAVSSHPGLRHRMVDQQRAWVDREGGRAVVEGRDIGSVVFPDAGVKVYLDAHPDTRAARRSGESGGEATSVAEALRRRDELDSTRPASPLVRAPDAHVIDTTHLSVDQVVERVLALVGDARQS
jgi:CMP/dCMP kinase